MNNLSQPSKGWCVQERKWGRRTGSTSKPPSTPGSPQTNPARGVSGSWMGFPPQQLTGASNFILDLAIRNGIFFPSLWKINNEKEIFLVVCLALTPVIARWLAGDCLFSKLQVPFNSVWWSGTLFLGTQSQTYPGLGPACGGRGFLAEALEEAAECQCYFRLTALAGAVILCFSKERKMKKTKLLGGRLEERVQKRERNSSRVS